MFNKKSKHQLFILLGLYFLNTSIIDPQPSLSKPVKVKKTVIKSSNPAKGIYPDERSIINPDISMAIEAAKKYQLNQPEGKSQLETSAQYEARLARHKASTGYIPEIEVIIPAKDRLNYDADKGIIHVNLKEEHELIGEYKNYNNLFSFDVGYKSVIILKQNITRYTIHPEENITCTNGYGAKFNYRHSRSESKRYGIALTSRDVYRAKDSYDLFSFRIPMNVDEVRQNITADEQNLNGNLKFVLKLKPASPFYLQETIYSGKECGDKYTPDGGSTKTFESDYKLALFDVVSVRIIDYSKNKVILETTYPQDINNSVVKTLSSPETMMLTPTTSIPKSSAPMVPNPNITIDETPAPIIPTSTVPTKPALMIPNPNIQFVR